MTPFETVSPKGWADFCRTHPSPLADALDQWTNQFTAGHVPSLLDSRLPHSIMRQAQDLAFFLLCQGRTELADRLMAQFEALNSAATQMAVQIKRLASRIPEEHDQPADTVDPSQQDLWDAETLRTLEQFDAYGLVLRPAFELSRQLRLLPKYTGFDFTVLRESRWEGLLMPDALDAMITVPNAARVLYLSAETVRDRLKEKGVLRNHGKAHAAKLGDVLRIFADDERYAEGVANLRKAIASRRIITESQKTAES